MAVIDDVKRVLDDTLELDGRALSFDADTPLFEGDVELDSLAIVDVIVGIEEEFGVTIEDDEITADLFDTVGTLAALVEPKVTEREAT